MKIFVRDFNNFRMNFPGFLSHLTVVLQLSMMKKPPEKEKIQK